MSNVVDMFSREPIEPPPAAADSEFITQFIEREYLDLCDLVRAIGESETPEEFFNYLRDLRSKIEAYPSSEDTWSPGPPSA